ncbi:MAG: methyltransferase domain-containing protein [Anaerolineaceae bacterium]|nr:methyltransferase domain-containing protein [Anaerolineaceae bacterium]
MSKKRFQDKIEKLRSAERLASLEVDRVVALCLGGIKVSSVLDVGTGSGLFAEAFVPFVVEVVGIDPNPEMVKAAKGFVPTAHFREGEAEAIPVEDKSFDLVFLGHVLHETDSPLTALKEAWRTAKKRVAVLEWPYIEEKTGPGLDVRINPDEVVLLAEKAGFENIEKISLKFMMLYLLSVEH